MQSLPGMSALAPPRPKLLRPSSCPGAVPTNASDLALGRPIEFTSYLSNRKLANA